jgi:hypothetical protein
MVIVITRLVVDFPVARNGRIALACWGLVPAAATAIISIMRVVSTFLNSVTAVVSYLRPLNYFLRQFLSPQPVKGNADKLSSLATRMSTFIFTKLVASMS